MYKIVTQEPGLAVPVSYPCGSERRSFLCSREAFMKRDQEECGGFRAGGLKQLEHLLDILLHSPFPNAEQPRLGLLTSKDTRDQIC